MRIGLISDTHGLMRPQALEALRGCDHIVHAGDIGVPEVLDALRALAPVSAIRGNIDRAPWAKSLPERLDLALAAARVHVLHDLKALAFDPAAAGVHAVICGHSHKPGLQTRDGVLYLNPGSAGPRRFKLPISVGFLRIEGGAIAGELLELG
ncbi:MAG TPA: metallophosphoesterase family protein [Pseudoxanthomonas sp.]|nr:metallophosphoesterase family protein [Pseudoxanthomonas sp.]